MTGTRRRFGAALLALALAALPVQALAQQTAPPATQVVIREGVRVKIRLLRELSSAKNQVGDTFEGEVVEDLAVDGKVAIARGAPANGTVTAVQRAGFLGKPGRIGFTFDYARAVDGTNVRLRAVAERQGQGKENTAWGLAILVSWLFLFMKGNEMVVKEGTEFSPYVDKDVTVMIPAPPAPPPDQPPPPPDQPPPDQPPPDQPPPPPGP